MFAGNRLALRSLVIAAFALLATTASAPATAYLETVRWQHPNPSTVNGFRIYARFANGTFGAPVFDGIPSRVDGVYSVDLDLSDSQDVHLAASAYDAGGESALSNEVIKAPPVPTPVCGNGVRETGEQCDDGNRNNGDGCDSNCNNEPDPVCGNGVRESGEQCDDGNRNNGDGCDSNCNNEPDPVCGNGVRESGEQCDDGNRNNGDGCDSNCNNEPDPVCGNGARESGEQCDDGNRNNGDGCDSNCNNEPDPVCGNGARESGEQCDDGNRNNGDGCDSDCNNEPDPVCGNGARESGEQCDDGNRNNGDGCDSDCNNEPDPVCGNGARESGEQCDDGNRNNGDGCDSDCNNEPDPVCGNGARESGEQCDDGNRNNGDGCDSDCRNEPDPICGNGLLENGEQCDDGNLENDDGCSEICEIEEEPEPSEVSVPMSINAGGDDIRVRGETWVSDQPYAVGGFSEFADVGIAGTPSDPVYQDRRETDDPNEPFGYEFPIANGRYALRLHFAETDPAILEAGERQFDVLVESQQVLENLDLVAEVGTRRAFVQELAVVVDDGSLSLELYGDVNGPTISGIEIMRRASNEDGTIPTAPPGAPGIKVRGKKK